jgi:hypothetical protein
MQYEVIVRGQNASVTLKEILPIVESAKSRPQEDHACDIRALLEEIEPLAREFLRRYAQSQ